jgi:hypothetical protein
VVEGINSLKLDLGLLCRRLVNLCSQGRGPGDTGQEAGRCGVDKNLSPHVRNRTQAVHPKVTPPPRT